jgi:hypothetical protein
MRRRKRERRLGRPPARWSRDSFSAGPPPNRAEPFPCYTALQWARSTASGLWISHPLPRLSSSACAPLPVIGFPNLGLLRALCDHETRVFEVIPPCTLAARPSVRSAVHACLSRPHGAVLDPQRSPRPSAGLGDESTWRSDAVARGPPWAEESEDGPAVYPRRSTAGAGPEPSDRLAPRDPATAAAVPRASGVGGRQG